jgi:hypothetical protein
VSSGPLNDVADVANCISSHGSSTWQAR